MKEKSKNTGSKKGRERDKASRTELREKERRREKEGYIHLVESSD